MLAHTRRGEGPHRVLLLHGFLGSGRNLGALVRAWSERDSSLGLVQADLLGHGRSPPIPEGADLYALGAAGLALMADAPEPFWVVGHSLGGRVALTMRAQAPDRVRAVTLLDIAPGPTLGLPSGDIARFLLEAPAEAPDRETFAQYFRGRGLTRGLTEWLLMNLDGVDGAYRWRVDREGLVAFHRRTGATDLWPVAEAHAAVIRAIRGAASNYVRAEDLERFRALDIPVSTAPDAGHFVHVDATAAVLDALEDQRAQVFGRAA
jgi:esterase